MSTYQKLKAKIKELDAEINELIFNPKTYEANMIRNKYKYLAELDKQIMAGSPTTVNHAIDDKWLQDKMKDFEMWLEDKKTEAKAEITVKNN